MRQQAECLPQGADGLLGKLGRGHFSTSAHDSDHMLHKHVRINEGLVVAS